MACNLPLYVAWSLVICCAIVFQYKVTVEARGIVNRVEFQDLTVGSLLFFLASYRSYLTRSAFWAENCL